tara:strand:- start:366 stop:1739 length:1374 start_codon:yes stop_codon:yes gene_type:complete
MKNKTTNYTIIFLLLFFSCNKNQEEILLSDIDLDKIRNSYNEYSYKNSHKAEYIYDQNKLHRFDIWLTNENLSKIDADPAAEQYVEGSLVFEDEVISKIGIRYKGSIGAWVGCLEGEDWSNPSGAKKCPKLSLKLKINWKGSDNKFYGLKKLQFHSQNLDPSKMHERLGYWMYRNFNVPAPRSNHAIIYINGEFSGLYANTEQIDSEFCNENFTNGDGNLYKEVWPVNNYNNATSEDRLKDALKTNEEISDVSKMKNFGIEVETASDNEIHSVVSKWIDTEQFLKTLVVDRRIANDDGFLHWYCGESGSCHNHNYYWYEDPVLNNIQLIPWDLDNAFENLVSDENPVTPIKDKWHEKSSNCKSFRFGQAGLYQRSASCDKIIGSYAIYIKQYDSLDNVFKNNFFNINRIDNLLDSWSNQIENSVEMAHKKYQNKEINISRWKSEVIKLKSNIKNSLN